MLRSIHTLLIKIKIQFIIHKLYMLFLARKYVSILLIPTHKIDRVQTILAIYAMKDIRLKFLHIQIIAEKSTNKIGNVKIKVNNHTNPVEELIASIYSPLSPLKLLKYL